MNVLTVILLAFSVLGAVDWLIGNKIGVGKEFERAFLLFCPLTLSMLGMIVLAPAVGVWLSPLFDGFYALFGIDPSIIPASLLANDMGGAVLAQSVSKSELMGNYNAFVVSSMMGCVISFTLPFSLGLVRKERYPQLFLGLLCGIATIPIGCVVAGLICRVPFVALLLDLLPLIVVGVLITLALLFFQNACIKCFAVFGQTMRVLSLIGLMCAIFAFLTKVEISPHFDSLENAALVCVNACVTLSGALPLMYLLTKLLHKPLNAMGARLGINGVSALAFFGTLVNNAPTFGTMENMDKKGTALNAAFSVAASFALGDHLAFTMAYDGSYVLPMIVGKVVSGVCAVLLVMVMYKEKTQTTE